ncbi:hypothetical protein [Streptomyces caatingaensis]|uniref:hypothetical protein n=1 Tax=Streptomyces caatingaensis TaxID=1678637 RepID=UPI0012FED2F3|nr:hypothetical protein [Streptomyces caatingaensis]
MSGALAVALAGAGPAAGTAAAAPAPAGPAAAAAAACGTDPGAEGLASRPVDGSLVSVGRADGRTAQFQLFQDATATRGLPFVWHREQDAPGGAFGPWKRVSAATVGPKSYAVTAVENSAGDLELLFSAYGVFCHTVEDDEGHWSAPDAFGLAPTPYHGGVVLFKERDGGIDAFASGAYGGGSMEVRHQQDADTGWGPVRSLGRVPEPDVGLSQPSTVEQLPDGRLHLTAREWNRDRTWEIRQTEPGGGWGPWRLLTAGAAPAPRTAAADGAHRPPASVPADQASAPRR